MTETALAKLDTAKRVLAEARDLTEVLRIREVAIAVQAVASSRRAEEAAALAMEVKLRAERKAGEFIPKEIFRGGNPKSHIATLKSLGINKSESERWQKIAIIPQKKFEQLLSDARTRTQKAVLQSYQELFTEIAREDPAPIKGPAGPWLRLELGDFREKTIDDNSVDMIFTDPPYGQEHLELWDGLGQVASRVLRPGGWLISYSGQAHLPQVLDQLSANLKYHWTLALKLSSHQFFRGVFVEWKPILAFYKPPFRQKQFADFLQGSGPEKQNHDWAQNHQEAVKLITTFSFPEQVVMDPMAGSGSTIEACIETNRHCIAFEKDPKTFAFLDKRFPDANHNN